MARDYQSTEDTLPNSGRGNDQDRISRWETPVTPMRRTHRSLIRTEKRSMARDNEVSILRKEDPAKAYFNCHTDITIPYDELGTITVDPRGWKHGRHYS